MFTRLREKLAARPPRRLSPELLPPGGVAWSALQEAAVLVPLFEHQGEAQVMFTRRRADLRQHGGQVSFPGGHVELGETSLAAALREAQEEISLDQRQVEVLGALDETLILRTGFRLTPWVGVVPYPYPYAPHPSEVEALIPVPLSGLMRPGVHRTEARLSLGAGGESCADVHYYDLPAVTVWGATARVLHQLLDLWSNP